MKKSSTEKQLKDVISGGMKTKPTASALIYETIKWAAVGGCCSFGTGLIANFLKDNEIDENEKEANIFFWPIFGALSGGIYGYNNAYNQKCYNKKLESLSVQSQEGSIGIVLPLDGIKITSEDTYNNLLKDGRSFIFLAYKNQDVVGASINGNNKYANSLRTLLDLPNKQKSFLTKHNKHFTSFCKAIMDIIPENSPDNVKSEIRKILGETIKREVKNKKSSFNTEKAMTKKISQNK